jgi:chromosome segregation ATPase
MSIMNAHDSIGVDDAHAHDADASPGSKYAKLAEERLRSSSERIVRLESDLQGTRRASDELKKKSSSDDAKIAELNDRLNKMHEITQARDIKEKALQAEIFEGRKDFKDLNLKHKAALALIKQVE